MIILCVKLSQGNKGPPFHWVIVCRRLVLPHAHFHFANVKPAAPLLSESAWFSLTRAKYLHHYDFQQKFSLVMRFWKRAKDLKATTKRSVKSWNRMKKKGCEGFEWTTGAHSEWLEQLFCAYTSTCLLSRWVGDKGVCSGDRCRKAEPQKTSTVSWLVSNQKFCAIPPFSLHHLGSTVQEQF